MNVRPWFLVLTAASLAAACGPKKDNTQVDNPDTSTTTETPTPPPPPPKKCEALDEKCEAKGGKKARIAGHPLKFEPVTGWTYAQGEKSTIAQSSDDGACMVVAGYDVADAKDTKKTDAARQAELDVLLGEAKITLGAKKINWKAPLGDLEAGSMKLLMWEVKAVTRNGKKGDLVVVGGPPAEGKAILAVGFVPEADETSGEKIVTSLQTLSAGGS